MAKKSVFILLTIITEIYAISLREQLNHINEVRESSLLQEKNIPSRRAFTFNRYEGGTVIGVPSRPSHLPAAEPILPGHTLLRPALGMLKSAIKYPHRENENGEGVYGHTDNLGIRYDGKNERVLYSGFRRKFSDDKMVDRREPTYTSSRNPKIIYILLIGAVDTNTYMTLSQTMKLHYSRRDDVNNENNPDLKNNESEGAEKPEDVVISSHEAAKDDKKWFWNSKDMFDHKRIPQSAPEYTDFLPPVTDKTQEWWFYSQMADYLEVTNNMTIDDYELLMYPPTTWLWEMTRFIIKQYGCENCGYNNGSDLFKLRELILPRDEVKKLIGFQFFWCSGISCRNEAYDHHQVQLS